MMEIVSLQVLMLEYSDRATFITYSLKPSLWWYEFWNNKQHTDDELIEFYNLWLADFHGKTHNLVTTVEISVQLQLQQKY